MVFKAITHTEFEKNLSSNFTFEDNPHIGLCISGGSDSMALLMLMRDWIKKFNGKISALHFDHNLRQESNLEANVLENKIKKLGVNFFKIEWKHKKINTRIMELARDARYKNIINLCRKLKIINLMTAHNFEDNLETYLMRKQRSSSSLGLSSIPKIKIVDSIRIMRPLLFYKKERLLATCKSFKVQWLEDKSNLDQKFERVRVRKFLKLRTLNEIKEISSEFKKKKEKNLSIEKKISTFFCEELIFFDYGVFHIRKKQFMKNPNFLKVEILKKLLTTAAGKIYSPKEKSILSFLNLLKTKTLFNYTLHTCFLKVCSDHIKIYKEILRKYNDKHFFLKKGERSVWQNRFTIESEKYDIEYNYITSKNWPYFKKKIGQKNTNLNFLTIQSLPMFKINKVKLIPFLSDKQSFDKVGIRFYFNPKIPLQKKNFF